jgi:hypothetical protein
MRRKSKREPKKVDGKPATVPRLPRKRNRVSGPPVSGLALPDVLPASTSGVRGSSPVQAWELKPGVGASFYHEGGSGDKHWAVGWRYGIVLHIIERGSKRGWVQLEIPVDLWGWNDGQEKRIDGKIIKKKSTPGWVPKPRLKAWCHSSAVNAPMDCIYHGPKLDEIVQARREQKDKDMSRSARRARAV